MTEHIDSLYTLKDIIKDNGLGIKTCKSKNSS